MNTKHFLTQVLSPYEAGCIVGYSATHVRLLLDTGKIVGKKVNGRWVVYLPSLVAYKNSPKVNRNSA